MNRARLLLSLTVVVMCLVAPPAAPDVTYTASFDQANLTMEPYGSGVLLHLPDTDLSGNVGSPWLPAKMIRLAIPVGEEVTGVTIDQTQSLKLAGPFAIASRPYPLAKSGPTRQPRIASKTYAPQPVVQYISTGYKSGYPIVAVQINPIQYNPTTGDVTLYTDVEFTVQTRTAASPFKTIKRRSARVENLVADDVRSLVDNPDDPIGKPGGGIVALSNYTDIVQIIVTSASFVSSFQTLANWYTKKGVPTQVVSMTTVGTYAGRDSAEKLRNCIRDYWQNHGLVYVILAGDTAVVPYRKAYAMATDNGTDIPCDLYFSDLDGTWDANNNSVFGELPGDNRPDLGDPLDLYADVYVSRAPVDNTTDCTVMINKIMQYEGSSARPALPTDYEKRALFVASWTDSDTDCSLLKEAILNESPDLKNNWTVTKLYERLGNLTPASFLSAMSTGKYNLINHSGHGDYNVMQAGGDNYISNNNLAVLTNAPRYSILTTDACYVGDFAHSGPVDCCAEEFALAANGGGYFIGNSHYGWYYGGEPATGLSAQQDRYFYNVLFGANVSPHLYNVAKTFAKAKDLGAAMAKTDQWERYCHYEWNLIGAAESPIWTETPVAFTVTYPATLPIGMSSTFTVHVTSGGSNVEGARVCLWRTTEIYVIADTDASGNATFTVSPVTAGTMYVTATKHNYLPYEGTASAIDTSAVTTSPTGWINPGWNWISFPLQPQNADPGSILGSAIATNNLFRWDPIGKTVELYPDDFQTVETGRGYVLFANVDVPASYRGWAKADGFEIALPAQGWSWIGQPFDHVSPQSGTYVRNNATSQVRSATEDCNAPDPWINWNWLYWDSVGDSARICCFAGGSDDTMLRPWYGYRVWVNVDNLTLVTH